MYRVVDVLIPTEEEEQLASRAKKKTSKKNTLPLAFKRHITQLTQRADVEAQIAVTASAARATTQAQAATLIATEVATSLNSSLTDSSLTDSLDSPAPALPPSSSPPVHPLYPCTHCGVTMTEAECINCYNSACLAPFHHPGKAGCKSSGKVWTTTEQLHYCKKACMQIDSGSGTAAIRSRRKR
jgi:hypothetical protein